MFRKTIRVVRSLRRFARTIVRQFLDDDCQETAAALTYQTLFAVVPLLTVMYAILNTFAAFSGFGARIEAFLFENVVPQNVGVIKDYLANFSAQARSLSGPSILLLGVTAFLMLFTIERTFNQIWRVRELRLPSQRFLMYWAVLTLSPFLVGLGFTISGYIVSLPIVSDVTVSTGALRYVPLLLSAALFTLIYVTVPNCVVPFRHALFGGILVAVLFELAKSGFARIMSQANFEVIYGTFAAVPLFLLWVYLSWTIILMGAEVVKGLNVFRIEGDERIESPLVQLLLILELFHTAHQRGEIIRDEDVRALSDRVELSEWNDLKARLTALNLIKPLDKGGLVLSRDLKEVSVWDIYRQVPFDMPQTLGGEKEWEQKLAERLGKIADRNEEYLQMSLDSLFRNEVPEKTGEQRKAMP